MQMVKKIFIRLNKNP